MLSTPFKNQKIIFFHHEKTNRLRAIAKQPLLSIATIQWKTLLGGRHLELFFFKYSVQIG